MSALRRVVLAGAGHSHIEVLRRWALQPPTGASLTLLVDSATAVYSGMVPGFVAGQYAADELCINAAELARRAGAEIVIDAAARIDADEHRIYTRSGRSVSYDLASINVGSTVVGRELPGIAKYSLPARPIAQLLAKTQALIAAAHTPRRQSQFRLLVVGGGAGGVELAFCFDARLRQNIRQPVEVMIAHRESRLLPGSHEPLRQRVLHAAARRGIVLRTNAEIVALDERSALLASGDRIEADAVVWVPGAAAHAFLGQGGLPLDQRGFVRIRPTLQVLGHDTLFAAGDCASLDGMRKAGVYAVRCGPILAQNLHNALAGKALLSYRPQPEFLSLLNLGDATAIGAKMAFAFEGRWVMLLKDRIDRRFMARYR